MKAMICAGILLAATAAHAETYTINVDRSNNTITTTGPNGTATTHVTRSANTVTRTTTYGGSGYQPMGSSGYRPTGNYNPTGR